MRVAYCGQLYASVVLGHRDRMEVRWVDVWVGRIQSTIGPQEVKLTLVFTLLLQGLLKHTFW